MPKTSVVLRISKVDSQGEAPIWIRIADRNATRFASLGWRVKPALWDKKAQRVRDRHPNAARINQQITKKLNELQGAILDAEREGDTADPGSLKSVVTKGRRGHEDYFQFADQHVEDLRRRGQLYLHKRYKSILKKLREFTGEPLPIGKLTMTLLSDFDTHLVTRFGNKGTTRASNFRAVRAILYKAYKKGHGNRAKNPFTDFDFPKDEANSPTRLSLNQLEALQSLDLPQRSLQWHVRDYWLFSFYCAGIRFGDFARLRWGNIAEGRLEYRMSKTGHPVSVRLQPPALSILDNYGPAKSRDDFIFPILAGVKPDAVAAKKSLVTSTGLLNFNRIAALRGTIGIGRVWVF